MKRLVNDPRIHTLKVMPMSTEKIRTLRFNSFMMLDSLMFLPAGLAALVEDLKTQEGVKFNILDQLNLYSEDELVKKNLLLRKGIFPYEFCKSIDQMRLCTSLPEQKHFYSKLTNKTVSDEDYAHAQSVWSEFECETLIEYMELYCLTDTALLAQVMIQYRADIMMEFELDCL